MQRINHFEITKFGGSIDDTVHYMNIEIEKLNLSLDKIISIVERDNYFIVFYKDPID